MCGNVADNKIGVNIMLVLSILALVVFCAVVVLAIFGIPLFSIMKDFKP
jgi:hypothetical protein